MKFTSVFAALLIAILAFASFAQIPEKQLVVLDELGAPVAGARVSVPNGPATITDKSGKCLIPISGTVTIEAEGFESLTISSQVEKVTLHPATLRQAMSITDTGWAISAAQVGAAISLIEQPRLEGDIRSELLDYLRGVGGLQVAQAGQRGGVASLFIRGGEGSFNKILIDGAPVNSIGGAFDFSQLSSTGISGIEILRGPNSVLYGADALSGVVSIETRTGTTKTPELTLSGSGGNFGTHDFQVSLGGTHRKLDYFGSVSRFDTRSNIQNGYFHNLTSVANLGWQVSDATRARAIYRQSWTGAGSPNASELFGISDDSNQRNINRSISARLSHVFTRRLELQSRFYYSDQTAKYSNPSPTGTPDPYGFGNYLGKTLTVVGGNGASVTGQAILDYYGSYPQDYSIYEARRSVYSQLDIELGRGWKAIGGYRYEHENGSGLTRNNLGVLGEVHGHVKHRLFLTGGLSLERNGVFEEAVTPRVSGAYYLRQPGRQSLFGETRISSNFGLGVKETGTYQQANQLWSLLTPAQRRLYHVEKLEPEESRGFDASLLQGIASGKARLQLSYFRNRFHDLISYLDPISLIAIGVSPDAAKASGYGAYVNASSLASNGIELKLELEPAKGLHIQLAYDRLNAEVTRAFGQAAINPAFPGIRIGAYTPLQGQRPFRRAPNSGNLLISYQAGRTSTFVSSYFVGRRDDSTFLTDAFFGNTLLLPNRDLLPRYSRVDLTEKIRLSSRFEIFASIQNLFSQHYQEAFGFPALPFSIRSGVKFTLGGQ